MCLNGATTLPVLQARRRRSSWSRSSTAACTGRCPASLIRRLLRPVVYRAEALIDRVRGVRREPAEVFTKIHETRSWRGASVSGTGSDPDATAPVLAALPELFASLGVRTLLDAPCGDGAWMAELDVPARALHRHRRGAGRGGEAAAAHGGPGREYLVADLIRDPLPKADLVLCRDCLVHLPFAEGIEALANLRRSGATWLLATTFPEPRRQRRHPDGPLAPAQPVPAAVLAAGAGAAASDEQFAADPRYADKSLGLWRL